MSWPRAFLPVPTALLAVDPSVAQVSPKASQADMTRWMNDVPRIYDRLARGATEADLLRDPQLAGTYRNLFMDSPSAQPLRAELDNGQLRVQAGQHRVRAAQAAGVPVVPVHVSAPDGATLAQVKARVEADAARLQPAAAEAHRQRDRGRERSRER